MSRLTEIMKQIPLDELMGDTAFTDTENKEKNKENRERKGEIIMNNKEIDNTNKTVFAKRTGSLVAAAAVAIVAVGGVFAYTKFSKSGPEADNITTSASQPATSSVADTSEVDSHYSPEDPGNEVKDKGAEELSKYVGQSYSFSGCTDGTDYYLHVGFYSVDLKDASFVTVAKDGTVKSYESIVSKADPDKAYDLPKVVYDAESFEIGGNKYLAVLYNADEEGGYDPCVMVIDISGEKPMLTNIVKEHIDADKHANDPKIKDEFGDDVTTLCESKNCIVIRNCVEVSSTGIRIEDREFLYKDGNFETVSEGKDTNDTLKKYLADKGIDAEIFEQYAVSTENGHKALYTFYYNLMSNSVLCKIDDNGTVTEYKTLKGMVSDNEYKFVRSIYDMDSFEIGGHRYVAILADKVTNGGIAPYIVILNVDGGEPKVTSAGEVKIDIKKYNASATSVFDGETELFLVDSFDDTLDTYMTVTDDGVSVVGNEYKELNGDLAMAQ